MFCTNNTVYLTPLQLFISTAALFWHCLCPIIWLLTCLIPWEKLKQGPSYVQIPLRFARKRRTTSDRATTSYPVYGRSFCIKVSCTLCTLKLPYSLDSRDELQKKNDWKHTMTLPCTVRCHYEDHVIIIDRPAFLSTIDFYINTTLMFYAWLYMRFDTDVI